MTCRCQFWVKQYTKFFGCSPCLESQVNSLLIYFHFLCGVFQFFHRSRQSPLTKLYERISNRFWLRSGTPVAPPSFSNWWFTCSVWKELPMLKGNFLRSANFITKQKCENPHKLTNLSLQYHPREHGCEWKIKNQRNNKYSRTRVQWELLCFLAPCLFLEGHFFKLL